MFVEFTEDYKQFKKGAKLSAPEFALEEYFTAGVVKEVEEVKEKPAPKPKAAPKKAAPRKAKPK